MLMVFRVSFQSMGLVTPIILTVKRGLRHVGGGAKSGAGLRYLLNTPAFKRCFGGLVLYSTYLTFTNEFFDVFVVKDESMLPALEEGNWVVVKRVGFTGYIRCALPLLPAFLGYKVELETKIKRRFAKISQSRRRPLLGLGPSRLPAHY